MSPRSLRKACQHYTYHIPHEGLTRRAARLPEETAAVHCLLQHAMIENDAVDPGASVVRKIALALGVSADTLLGIKQELEKVEQEA